jgi:nicotinamide-nucleotide amidase
MYFSKEILDLSSRLVSGLQAAGMTVATAESCTGGLIGGAITEVSGASAVFMGGFVTYDNRLKREVLGVGAELLERHGAVSSEVARAMAKGARARARVSLAVAVTGIAGPGGGGKDKPVGLVHLAVAREGGETVNHSHVFSGSRADVRAQTVESALRLLLQSLPPRA